MFTEEYSATGIRAPEFWCYYTAKVLGVDMIELEREIPLWQALHSTFKI